MTIDKIKVSKAKVHNLKSVSIEIPKNSFTVVTGPSGSGKSSLAFDTIYIEGQRRYIESLSSYARQFLGQFSPPDVESITGLSPAIAIDQKSTSRNPRSTVGTVTEIYDYMRILWARVGDAYCPISKEKVESQSPQQMVDSILRNKEKSKIILMAPIIKNRKGEHKDLLEKFLGMGFSRVRVDGEILPLSGDIKINKNLNHNIEIVIDRIVLKDGTRGRMTDSVELALKLGDGHLLCLIDDEEIFFSESNYSAKSGKSYPDLEPRLFSFNSPLGACKSCNGLGQIKQFNMGSLVKDSSLSIEEGAIPLLKKNSFLKNMISCIAKAEKVDLDKPFSKLPKKFTKLLEFGSDKIYSYSFESENSIFRFKKDFPGISQWLERKYNETSSDKTRVELEKHMDISPCKACDGHRLNDFSRNVLVGDRPIMEVTNLSLDQAFEFFSTLNLKGQKKTIGDKVLKEIIDRLSFLNNVGLTYLTLNRSANTLSGGESQRIRLATQIGSALSGVLYVLDEPSIGLHQRDNDRLIKTLLQLRDLGNTVIVVEHDEETMRNADFIVDIGPGAGVGGGEVVAKGKLREILKSKNSITAQYLNGKKSIDVPTERRKLTNRLCVTSAKHNNLKSIDLNIPLGGLVCITGVSGSGKSTLIHKVLTPAVKNNIKGNYQAPNYNNYDKITGTDQIQSVIELDQSPIGRTPKSNPATYSGLFDLIRTLFSNTNEAKTRGYKPGRFSFNVKGGRCDTCEGNGSIKIEMHFLPDVYITCAECSGKRYNQETLNILYRGKSIADVLAMTIDEAVEFFSNHKKIARILGTLKDVGLGYMTLGQSSTTLSGGEAQRLKLAKELAKSTKGHCLYILDEPTTGLHFNDIKILLKAVDKLVSLDNTAIIIEHNLDVIKTADWIIDLGPEGGKNGGEIVAQGTPEQVSKVRKSYTGKYLKSILS